MQITIEFESARGRRVARALAAVAGAVAVVTPLVVWGGPVGSLVSFSPGQTIRAADFNANFAAIQTAVNDNDARIGNLSTLQTTNKASLVGAVNEVFAKAPATGAQGPQGPQGPQGIPGAQKIFDYVQGRVTDTSNFSLASSFASYSASVSGGTVAGTLSCQVQNASTGAPAVPTTPGTITFQLKCGFVPPNGATTLFVALGPPQSVAVNGSAVQTVPIAGTLPPLPGSGSTPPFASGSTLTSSVLLEWDITSMGTTVLGGSNALYAAGNVAITVP